MHGADTRGKYRIAIETRAKRHFRCAAPRRILGPGSMACAMAQKETPMLTTTHRRAVAAFAFLVAGLAGPAQAGDCTSGHKANARGPVDHAVQGVTDTTLGAIDLGKEQAKITGRELRFRKMVIEAGGVVPWHSHD